MSWSWKVSYSSQGKREFATTPPLEKGFCLRSEGERVCFGFTQGETLGPPPNPTVTSTTCSPVLPVGVLWSPDLPHYFSGAPGGGLGLQTHSSHTGLQESVKTLACMATAFLSCICQSCNGGPLLGGLIPFWNSAKSPLPCGLSRLMGSGKTVIL